ncbi:MAG TPA: YetF domain-containing protein, partial [Gemmataceae bacterium]|nr:YetF domain-containing protein [Gemmataceae bacterium]
LRLTGRRQAGELNLHDILLVLILANAVQNAMTQGDGRLTVALVSSGTLVLLGTLLALLQSRFPSLEKHMVGEPTVLVEGGRMLRREMRREGVTEEDVLAAVREQGLADLAAAKLVVLEVDGSISVIPQEQGSQG